MKLVIVESPGKIKTIKKYLSDDFEVIASVGHIMEIPKSGLNINVEDGSFLPVVQIIPGKENIVASIKEKSRLADEVFLCTDSDREGARISADIATFIDDKTKIRRAVFNEITKKALLHAIKNPINIDINMVNSQVARQVLDRLIGYMVSPMLWNNTPGGKSAGRVQSVALRLIAEREFEIEKFVSEKFWDIQVNFIKNNVKFSGVVKTENKNKFLSKKEVDKVKKDLELSDFIVSSIKNKSLKRSPYPPFDTAGLQKISSSSLGWSGKQTMETAQFLYEAGKITYMRTDSFMVSDDAYNMCNEYIKNNLGEEYIPSERREYKKKTISQEAHECIRPTFLDSDMDSDLDDDQKKLFNLIRDRFIASQMSDMITDKIDIEVNCGENIILLEGKSINFDGWSKVWESDSKELFLPDINKGEKLLSEEIKIKEHETRPPDRFNDGSLVAKMEKEGIGRPSTWATLVDNLIMRNYVVKEGKNFVLTAIGRSVFLYLIKEFGDFFLDISFTSKIEDDLDRISNGELNRVDLIKKFYDSLFASVNKNRINAWAEIFG